MILIILIIIFSLYFSAILRLKILKMETVFKNDKEFYDTILVVSIFIIVFILIFRFFRFFTKKNFYFDFWFWFGLVENLNFDIKLLIVFFVVLLFHLRNFVFFFVKVHFIKLFFYFFLDLNSWLLKIKKRYNFIKNNKIISFFNFYGIKVIILLLFFHGFFYNEGKIYLGFMPVIAIYYFFLRGLFFIFKLNESFSLCCCFLYKKNVKFNENSLYKLDEYKKYLIFNYSRFRFHENFFINESEISDNILYLRENEDFFIESKKK